MIPQVNLYSQNVSLPLLRVLYNPETDILVIEYLILPLCLLELVRLHIVRVLLEGLFTLIQLGHVTLVRILHYSNIYPVTIITTIRIAVPVHIFVNSTIITPIVLKIEEDIVIGSRIVANITVVIALRLVISISIAIIIIITMRRLPRVYLLTSLFSLTERVFTGFAL